MNKPTYYRPQRHEARPATQTSTLHYDWRKIGIAIVVTVALAFTGIRVVSALSGRHHHAVHKISPLKNGSTTAMNAAINRIVAAQQYSIGVSLEDISTGDVLTYGATTPFDAASTAKVVAACAFYHLVETGHASLAQPMGAYNAQFNLKEMINISDNDSWHNITAAVGIDNLKAYAASIGVDYDTDTNSLTPSGEARILSQLYAGKLLNKADTAQLLSYMQNTNEESMIPAAVPSSITVYHKYGLLDGALHDAGILAQGTTRYALVIYTQNTDDSDDVARTDTIQSITRIVAKELFR